MARTETAPPGSAEEKGLSGRFRGSRGSLTARQRRAMASAVEEGEGDEVVGRSEAVSDSCEEAKLGVDALGQPVGQTVGDGGDDPAPVLLDAVVEIDEGRDPA